MNYYSIIFLTAALSLSVSLKSQEVEQDIKKGNDLYRQQLYQQAEAAYNEALAKESSNTIAKFNRANTAYRLAKPVEAMRNFDELAASFQETEDKAKSYYNKGVILSNQKKLEESIEAYKNSLRQNPADKEARENLQKALIELKKKTPPPKKEEEKNEQQQNQKQQSRMNQKEAEQKLKLLEQKEKELQQKIQKQKLKVVTPGPKDW